MTVLVVASVAPIGQMSGADTGCGIRIALRSCGELGTNSSLLPGEPEQARDSRDQPEFECMHEPLSPELVLVDPDLAARARAALPDPAPRPVFRQVHSAAPAAPTRSAERAEGTRPYPLWARVTAALWLLVLGILIGGAAIPHAQDTPRVLPPAESICEPTNAPSPSVPGFGSPLRPGR